MLTARLPQSPHRLAMLGSVWLSCFGHLQLWRTLAQLPELADGRAPVFIGSAMLLLAALFTLVFSLLAWPRVIRPALSLGLLGTAWSALHTTPLANVPATTLFLLLAGGPLTWLWSRPVLHAHDTRTQCLHNLSLAMAAAGVIAAMLILSIADFTWMWMQHADLVELLSPTPLWRGLAAFRNILTITLSLSPR